MAKKVHLRVVTPTKISFDKDVDMVILRGIMGDLGILPGHAPCSTIMGYGPLRILDEDEEKHLAVLGGFAEIDEENVTILSDAAEWPEEIDKIRAEAARERAERRIREKASDADMQRAELSLRRSLVRIEVSSYPLIKNSNKSK